MATPELVHTPLGDIAGIVDGARAAHQDGALTSLESREALLRAFRELVVERSDDVLAALATDLRKPRFEGWATEVGYVLSDIDYTLAHLRSWAAHRRVPTPVIFQPGSSTVVPEPLGVACVIAPWNYPFQLLVLPALAAIAAGNAVVLKPSEVAPATARMSEELFRSLRSPAVGVVQGGVEETTELLTQRFDHIFYTGNGNVGRIVMRAAAEHLTPVTLELGGKSPAIVSRNANLDVAAKRVAWGKYLNAGQTCIAPDYVLVEGAVRDEFLDRLGAAVRSFYGDDPQVSPDYPRIVSDRHFARIEKLLGAGTVVFGGQTDPGDRYVAPTVLVDVSRDDQVMQEEIFGPILPVLDVGSIDEAVQFVRAGDKPLALYVFSEDDGEVDDVLARTSSGGACVNGTILQLSPPDLPFGGVGPSGMGAYHGRSGFDTFSHLKAVHKRSTRLDPPVMYPPYTAAKEKVLEVGISLGDPRDRIAKLFNRLRRR